MVQPVHRGYRQEADAEYYIGVSGLALSQTLNTHTHGASTLPSSAISVLTFAFSMSPKHCRRNKVFASGKYDDDDTRRAATKDIYEGREEPRAGSQGSTTTQLGVSNFENRLLKIHKSLSMMTTR